MRVPSVAVLAALTVVVHAAPGRDSSPTLPSTPEIVRMFSEPAASVEEVDISDDSDEAARSSNYQGKRSYERPPPPQPPKQFCIEIRPKNPEQSPFVICEPPTQPYYPQPPPPPQIPYPYHPAPPVYPPGPSAYSPPSAPPSPPQTGGKPYQRSNVMGFNAEDGMMTMMMMPMMGGFRNAEAAAAPPPPMQFPHPSNPSAIAPVLQPPPGPVMTQPMPPPASGRSSYPQPYGTYGTYDQTPPVTMQCHTPPGYQSYHGYQNPVALLQLFLKPSHHHHHHTGYYSASTEAPSYRAAAGQGSTPKPSQTTSTPLNTTHTSASDQSTEGPLRIPIPIDTVTTDSAQDPQVFKGPHITPDGSHPDTKKIPGITTPGRPSPVFQPGGGAALLKPSNASAAKMSDGGADIAVNMVDGPPPMGRSGVPQYAAPHEAWAGYSSMGGNDMIMPENHIIPGHMFMPKDMPKP